MKADRYKIARNLKVLPIFYFLVEFRLYKLIEILYFAKILNSFALGMSIFTISLFATSLFEVPTGIISDKIGRKRTMSIGVITDVIGVLFYGLASIYSPYLFLALGGIFIGIAESFYSGTDDALSYETMKQLKKTKKYPGFSGKLNSMLQLSLAISALLAGFLSYMYSYSFVIWLSAIPLLFCLISSFFLVEPISIEEHKNNTLSHLKESLKNFKNNRKLRLLSIAKIIGFAVGTSSHRFESAYFATLIPIWLIGIVRFIKQFGGFIGFWFSGKIIDKFGSKDTLYVTRVVMCSVKLVALALNSVVTPFMFSMLNFFFGPSNIALKNLMQKEFSNKQRATMGSVVSLFGNLFFGVFTILMGYIADITSPRVAIFCAVLPLLFTLHLYKKIFARGE